MPSAHFNRSNSVSARSKTMLLWRVLKLVCRIPKEKLIGEGEKNICIKGMSYNSARDELFLADDRNGVVRAIRVRDYDGNLREVCRVMPKNVWSVCQMSDSDTLLVCTGEPRGNKWLVALSRNGRGWREAHRVQTDERGESSCALSDSRVLIGERRSTYMELFSVESGPRIARVHRIHVPEEYHWFSATCGSDTLVAMSHSDQSVRLHRLHGDRLEELARIQMKWPKRLLWLADRLLVVDYDSEKDSHTVIELEVSDTRLERRSELIATSGNIHVHSWCAVSDELAIVDDRTKDILHYSFETSNLEFSRTSTTTSNTKCCLLS